LVWLSAMVWLYTAVAYELSPQLFSQNLRQFALHGLIAILILSYLGLLGALIAVRPKSPLRFIAGIVSSRGVGFISIAVATCFGMAAFWTFKYHIPSVAPFYADRLFADLDSALHFGNDPWRLAHSVMPSSAMGPMVVIYFPVWYFQFFICLFVAALQPNASLRNRYFISLATTYLLLGTIMAAALSSVGPIFYDRFIDGERFSELLLTLHRNEASTFIFVVADRLLSAYSSGVEDIFAGISAMPSIHVAVAALNAVFLAQINRWLGFIGWVFTALTLFGSVYFGWHYAIDGYVSIFAVLLIWRRCTL
jgi:PAP2 superfamily